jgi:hypothetical protein
VDCCAQFQAIEVEETIHQDGRCALVAPKPGVVFDQAKAQRGGLANDVRPFKSCSMTRASQSRFDQGTIKDAEVALPRRRMSMMCSVTASGYVR